MSKLPFEIISKSESATESMATVLSFEVTEYDYAEHLAKAFKCEKFSVGLEDKGNTSVSFTGGDHDLAMSTFLYNR